MMLSKFKTLSKPAKTTLIIAAAIAILLLSPLVVKAATDGEVDLYADLMAEIQRLREENEDLREQLAAQEEPEPVVEVQGETTLQVEEEPIVVQTEPEPEPTMETTTTTTEEPEPDPEPEPEPNPYAGVSLAGVHVVAIDNVAHFGRWLIVVDDENVPDMMCYTDSEKVKKEADITAAGHTFTTTALHVDPLLYEIVAGKKFNNPGEAIAYIESKIAGN